MRRADARGARGVPPLVLIVMPSFFGYEEAIASEFRRLGAEVMLVDERPSNRSWAKAVARVWPTLLKRLTQIHYVRALERLPRPVDLAIYVKGEVVPEWFVSEISRRSPDGVAAFYAFDSFANSPRGLNLVATVEHPFSFDREDVARYPRLTYLPLFHTREFRPGPPLASRPNDLAFVGTVHSGRYDVCRRLAPAGRRRDFFFYSPARWHHALTWVRHPDIRRIPWSDVSFVKRSRRDVAETFRAARAVIDVPRVGQSGLTMRTFEVLACGTKLITSNASVREESFYDERWIYVLPEDPRAWDLAEIREFVAEPTAPPADVMTGFDLEGWVRRFLDLLERHEANSA